MSIYKMSDLRRKGSIMTKSLVESSLVRLANSQSSNFDIFLSQRKLDSIVVEALRKDLESFGFSVYVDWKNDSSLDRENVNKDSAQKIRSRLKSCKSLLYVDTENSEHSKWMPWELGYFDGFKGRVAILPVTNSDVETNRYSGREYLNLYPYVTKEESSKGVPKLWINQGTDEYVELGSWLKGKDPYKRE